MVKSVKELYGATIQAEDGNIGSVVDVYFDDETGRLRYFVVDTAKWLPGRKVLIGSEAIRRPWHDGAGLPVNLTREQVKSSPDIDTEMPVSREAELLLHSHYGWAPYWAGGLLPPPPPKLAAPVEERQQAESVAGDLRTSHLRSSREVMGYEIHGMDGKAGTLEDLLIDPEEGRIRYLVVKTGEWLSHKNVLITPNRIANVNWSESKIETKVSRHDIKVCPEYGSLVS